MKYNRGKFLLFLKDFIEKKNVKIVAEISSDVKIVVTRVSDFDPQSNEVWHIQANKSYERQGVVCCQCKNPVVMSDFAFKEYSKTQNPEQIICGQCAFKL